ncbi:COG3904 family protein [Arenibacterium sp. CAU 1754]
MILQLTLILLFAASAARTDETRISAACELGLVREECYLIVDGRLDKDVPARFQALLAEAKGHSVLLNSTGGDLAAGLELGRMIRAEGFSTRVGRADFSRVTEFSPWVEVLDDAACASACAYAFVGGVGRHVPQAARLGFHRVALPGGRDLPGQGGLASGQQISALLIEYLAEMGINPGIFVAAGNTPVAQMYYPTRLELERFNLVTPEGFGPFRLEPYGAGVIAISDRKEAPRRRDDVIKVTAYCQAGRPRIILTTHESLLPQSEIAKGTRSVSLGTSRAPPEKVTLRADAAHNYIEFVLRPDHLSLLRDAVTLGASYGESSFDWGVFQVNALIRLDATDRKMLDAAFRLCI